MAEFGNLGAVIWDLDGVIINSGPQHFQSWHDALAPYEISVSDDQLRQLFGMTSPEVVRILFGEDVSKALAARIGEEKERLFRTDIKTSAAYLPGVEIWLNHFQTAGLPQALASSGSQENIDTMLTALDARDFFKVIVSGRGMPSKPHPDVFQRAADQLQIRPDACLVIEDAIAGVAGAKAAGMKCLAVTTTNPPVELARADLILENLTELTLTHLKTLFP